MADLPPNRVKVFSATTGTGASITLGARVSDMFATLAEAGGQDTHAYEYMIEQGGEWEHNSGVWTSGTNSIARGTPSQSRVGGTYGTSKINLNGTEIVYFPYFKETLSGLVTGSVRMRKRYYLIANDGAVWTKPDDVSFTGVTVWCWGPGGGSGGSSASNSTQGGGGGGGAFCFKQIAAAALGATETIAVGTGGAAGTTTTSGSAGNKATAFGAQCSAGAGAGGLVGGGSSADTAAGTATGGDININGGPGIGPCAAGGKTGSSGNDGILSGYGGACANDYDLNYGNPVSADCVVSAFPCFGGGHGQAPPGFYEGGSKPGRAGQFPGGGAAGGWKRSTAAAQAGAAGANGFMIVEENYG